MTDEVTAAILSCTKLSCIQCSMRALVNGDPPPIFEETVEAHMARVHPDPEQTSRERQQLEQTLRARWAGRDAN